VIIVGFVSIKYHIYCQLCFDSTSFSVAQHMYGNYYLYMNEQLVVTPNLLIQNVHRSRICVFKNL